MTLSALAQATRRLRLGTLVTGIHHRHPALLANMAATLDVISGGRLELGIGTGWNQEESHAYGIELGSPRPRSGRCEEACEVLTALLLPLPYSPHVLEPLADELAGMGRPGAPSVTARAAPGPFWSGPHAVRLVTSRS
ncbi:LLM class flavin-dependent oxidoreductase [Streptomyces sp. NPDC004008]